MLASRFSGRRRKTSQGQTSKQISQPLHFARRATRSCARPCRPRLDRTAVEGNRLGLNPHLPALAFPEVDPGEPASLSSPGWSARKWEPRDSARVSEAGGTSRQPGSCCGSRAAWRVRGIAAASGERRRADPDLLEGCAQALTSLQDAHLRLEDQRVHALDDLIGARRTGRLPSTGAVARPPARRSRRHRVKPVRLSAGTRPRRDRCALRSHRAHRRPSIEEAGIQRLGHSGCEETGRSD